MRTIIFFVNDLKPHWQYRPVWIAQPNTWCVLAKLLPNWLDHINNVKRIWSISWQKILLGNSNNILILFPKISWLCYENQTHTTSMITNWKFTHPEVLVHNALCYVSVSTTCGHFVYQNLAKTVNLNFSTGYFYIALNEVI